MPSNPELEVIIAKNDPQTRHAVIAAVLVRGAADVPLARAMLSRWSDLFYREKMDVVLAIDESCVRSVLSVQEQELRVLERERDPRVQVLALLTVRDEIPPAALLPLLREYIQAGPDSVRVPAYATAVKMGKSVADQLKRELHERGASEALSFIQRWEKEGQAPCSVSPEPRR